MKFNKIILVINNCMLMKQRWAKNRVDMLDDFVKNKLKTES